MKKLYIIVLILLSYSVIDVAQSCLPDGISFSDQQQIDDFSTIYPNCDTILGDVCIGDCSPSQKFSNIINLNGLSQLKFIKGFLDISYNDKLLSLNGLNNVRNIKKSLIIQYNDNLKNLDGLQMIDSIGGLNINWNKKLSNLNALKDVKYIGGFVTIIGNKVLKNLSGLENIDTVYGGLYIEYNDALTNLKNFRKLIYVRRGFNVSNNKSLKSLDGFENLTSIGSLHFTRNDSLTDLDGLKSLKSIRGSISIDGNKSLTNLNGLDKIKLVHSYLFIRNNDKLANLIGLGNIFYISDFLYIGYNDILTDLNGLDNVSKINGYLEIERNGKLVNLNGLNKLTRVKGNLIINQNKSLENLDGLNNLNSINGFFEIRKNKVLNNISSIQNLNPNTIESNDSTHKDLEIVGNLQLSHCEVESICAFLVLPQKTKEISKNMIGCNSDDEVNVRCGNPPDCSNLSINSQVDNASCFGYCNGSIEIINVDNSTPPLNYKWNINLNTPLISNLCSGDYIVTITDSNNCIIIDSFSVLQPNEIKITIDSTRDIRLDLPGYIAISTNNSDNYIFSWSGPGNFSSITEDLDSLNEFGCYTLTVTDTITNCSIDSTICLEDKTGIFNIEFDKIHIYPNPAKKDLFINFIGTKFSNAQITFFDISGMQRLNIDKRLTNSIIKVNTEDLNSGLYIIRVKSDRYGTLYRKLIIHK